MLVIVERIIRHRFFIQYFGLSEQLLSFLE